MRRQKYRQQKQKVNKKYFAIFTVIFFATLFLIGLYFILIIPRLEKFIFVNKTENGGGEIVIVGNDSITKYLVDSDTLLDSTRGLGEYKLASLWILGEKEGYGGKLVAETVSKNYSIPIYFWKNGSKSNLNLTQMIKVKSINLSDIPVKKSFDGYNLSKTVLVEFVDQAIQEYGVLVEVDDFTGSQKTLERVSLILGTMGTKIAGYSKGFDKDLDCVVSGKNKEIVEKFALVFDCKIKSEDRENIKISLGAKFAERF